MSNPILLLLVPLVAVLAFVYFKKKRNAKPREGISQRAEKDEVWKTIKKFLKDNGDYGQEIVDSYVAKRNEIDYVDPNLAYVNKNKITMFNKIRKWQQKQAKKLAKETNQPNNFLPLKPRDIYVVTFISKDVKTNKLHEPRSIECEVVNQKTGKKEYERKIVINRELDYNKEMQWIAPIRAAEEAKARPLEQKKAKKQAKKEARKAKKEAKKKNAKK